MVPLQVKIIKGLSYIVRQLAGYLILIETVDNHSAMPWAECRQEI